VQADAVIVTLPLGVLKVPSCTLLRLEAQLAPVAAPYCALLRLIVTLCAGAGGAGAGARLHRQARAVAFDPPPALIAGPYCRPLLQAPIAGPYCRPLLQARAVAFDPPLPPWKQAPAPAPAIRQQAQ
jgi:hypothetical protein